MKSLLFRFKVNGRTVGEVLSDGEVRWEEYEVLKTFAQQHLIPSVLSSDDVETIVGMDIDLISLPSELRSGAQASVKVVFGVEERAWKPPVV